MRIYYKHKVRGVFKMSLITKKAIANSLKKLMNTVPLDKITVKNIVLDCGVNRQTFYYHFQDIYDLLGWIYKTEVVGSISSYSTYDGWQKAFLDIFEYVRENKKFCMNTLNSMGRDHLEDFLYAQSFSLLMNVINEISANIDVPKKSKEFIANFYSFAFIGVLISWMKNNMKEDPELIISNIDKLISGDIRKAILTRS